MKPNLMCVLARPSQWKAMNSEPEYIGGWPSIAKVRAVESLNV